MTEQLPKYGGTSNTCWHKKAAVYAAAFLLSGL
jgi:hypothetical protein